MPPLGVYISSYFLTLRAYNIALAIITLIKHKTADKMATPIQLSVSGLCVLKCQFDDTCNGLYSYYIFINQLYQCEFKHPNTNVNIFVYFNKPLN